MDNNIYFITGGGTGGHIYPAVAVADELLEDKQSKVFYVGNPNNMEADIIKSKPYEFLPVVSSGMPRKASLSFFKWAFNMLSACIKCCFYIKKYRPKAVFGTGGYVSAPVLAAAVLCHVPFVMHDCDANPGLVTRKLAPYARSVSVAFEVAKNRLKNKNIIVNGNPIRKEFSVIQKGEARKKLGLENKTTLCVMGGSQGAKTINSAAVEIIKRLSEDCNIQIIFQTGKKNYDEVVSCLKNNYPEYENDKNLIIRPYFDNMYEVLKASDIAVSRAGSLSISELCASGVAAIYVPYPYAAADHQRKNAKSMVECGAGLYLEDADTTAEKLFDIVASLLNSPERLADIQAAAQKLAKYDAVEKIAGQIKAI